MVEYFYIQSTLISNKKPVYFGTNSSKIKVENSDKHGTGSDQKLVQVVGSVLLKHVRSVSCIMKKITNHRKSNRAQTSLNYFQMSVIENGKRHKAYSWYDCNEKEKNLSASPTSRMKF